MHTGGMSRAPQGRLWSARHALDRSEGAPFLEVSHVSSALLPLSLLTLTAGAVHAETLVAGGDIDTDQTWTAANSPYIVDGDITVLEGASLVIEEGVEVRATAHADSQGSGVRTNQVEIGVRGRLAINGTSDNPVLLSSTANPNSMTASWYGIRVLDGAEVSLSHVRMEGTVNGIESDNGTGVLTTDHVFIVSPQTRGVWLRAGTPTLHRVEVSRPGRYGIDIEGSSSPTITGCVVTGSSDYGIWVHPSSPGTTVTLRNCTLDGNQMNVRASPTEDASPTSLSIVDSILSNHNIGVSATNTDVYVSYSNVWRFNNANPFVGEISVGEGVIAANPLYVSDSDLRLTSRSPSRLSGENGGHQGRIPSMAS